MKRNVLSVAIDRAIHTMRKRPPLRGYQQKAIEAMKRCKVASLPKNAGKTNEITQTLSGKEFPEALFTGNGMNEIPEVIVGGEYRPKRANQHSKNFIVTSIEDDVVNYTRGGVAGYANAVGFLGMIGRAVAYDVGRA